MFYDIPQHYSSGKFFYRLNEQIPNDAQNFDLSTINLKNFNDTPEFDRIPKLQHGLNRLLDGKIYKGDMGFGKFPPVNKDFISKISEYKPPSMDNKLLQITQK